MTINKQNGTAVRISNASHTKLIEMQETIWKLTGMNLSLSDITNLLIHKTFIKDIKFLLGDTK